MSKIKKNYLVKKRNLLNEIRATSMTLQELRFFSIYLSKINPNDLSTRVVRFSIPDFQAIMELDSEIEINYMKKVTNNLLCKVVNVPNERGGYEGFQLFKECKVDTDDRGVWYIEIDAHDKALPLMFEFRSNFFSYQLWNALGLRSRNQLRMYEILKQYEKIAFKVFSIDELKELLGIKKIEYPRFGDLKIRVLDACQQALQECTDIKFTYEPYGKKGVGGKVLFLKFNIEKNKDYVDKLTLSDFINKRDYERIKLQEKQKRENERVDEDIDEYIEDIGMDFDQDAGSAVFSPYNQRIEMLMEVCNNEFSFKETVVLLNEMRKKLPYSSIRDSVACCDYLVDKYNEMEMRSEKKKIIHRFNYLRTLIKRDDCQK